MFSSEDAQWISVSLANYVREFYGERELHDVRFDNKIEDRASLYARCMISGEQSNGVREEHAYPLIIHLNDYKAYGNKELLTAINILITHVMHENKLWR